MPFLSIQQKNAFFICIYGKKVVILQRKLQNELINTMSAQENQAKALAYIASQSNTVTDYQWEIQHHREMHEAYEKSL